MFENLDQPYIFNNNFKHSVKTIILVSMAYMLIVLYFQPFGVNFLKSTSDGYFVLGTGIFTAITFFVNTQVLPGIFPKTFDSKRWTVKKEIIQNICMFIFLSFSFGLLAYLFNIALVNYSLPMFLTGALALLPIILFNLSNYNNSLKVKMVHVFDSGKQWLADEKKHDVINVKFVSESGKESMQFDSDKLLLLKSCGNYVEIYFVVDQKVRKSLLRQTLSNLESLLSDNTNFVRAHRCCLINFSYFSKMTNLSGSYSLQLSGLDMNIPIARGKVGLLKALSQDKEHVSSVL